MKKNNKGIKKSMLILVLFLMVLTLVGGTLSFWTWYSTDAEKTVINFTVPVPDEEVNFSCAVDGGGDITSEDVVIMPSTCMDSEHAIQRQITTMATFEDGAPSSVDYRLWLDIRSIGSGLSNSQNFMYALTTSSTSCSEGVISNGNFNGKSDGDTITILDTLYSDTTSETYYLYIWLDEAETSVSTTKQSFDITLGGVCENDAMIAPEAPVISDGMIPVTISADGTVKTISKDDSSWYDYSTQKWANMVLVTDSSRGRYEGTIGKTITQSDILAYYTWIPRYKYKIWTTTTGSSPQEIDILFESKNAPMDLGTDVGEYRTHPAFWWDEDSDNVVDDGEMVAGIWVGKFETSTDTSSACYTSEGAYNCSNTNQSPRILPNVKSLRNQFVSEQFVTSQKFSELGNIYGLSNLKTDAHMMKNSEWGAVAYLSHSKYGINEEIYINNSTSYYTGRSGGNVGSDSLSINSYGNYTWLGQSVDSSGTIGNFVSDRTLGTKASTTGNVTGIYDMSGGSYEYVMGFLADSSGNPLVGNTAPYQMSGFNGMLNGGTSYTSGINFPASKYYDLYNGTNGDNSCNGGKCYGHALSETANWYGDSMDFVESNSSIFIRGGGYSYSAGAGAFNAFHMNGQYYGYSWRSVLTPVDRADDNKVTVTYYNGTTKISSSVYEKGTTIDLTSWDDLDTDVINGDLNWSFYGWSGSSNSYSITLEDNDSVELTGDLNVYAVYRRFGCLRYGTNANTTNTYYYWNPFGTEPGIHYSSIAKPSNMSVSNWTFVGWRDDDTASTAEVEASSQVYIPPDMNYMLRAVYKRPYTISYNANGGSGTTSATTIDAYFNSGTSLASVNSTVTMAANGFTRSGYGFNGWNTAADGSGTSYSASTSYSYSTTISYNASTFGITLYAQWSTKPVHIYYNANGGSIESSTTDSSGVTNSWSLTSEGLVKKNGEVFVQTIQPGGTTGTDGLVNYNNAGYYINITKSGYTALSGTEWNTAADGSGTSLDDTGELGYDYLSSIAVDNGTYYTLTLYVNWVLPPDITITYYNGTTLLGTSQHYSFDGSNLKTFSELGGSVQNSDYGWDTFVGWVSSSSATEIDYLDGQGVITNENLTLYALYSRTLTFYSGTHPSTVIDSSGTTGTMVTDGTRTQYMNSSGKNVSSVTSYTPSTLSGWSSHGYRDDISTGWYEYDKNTSISPAYNVSNVFYAIYHKVYYIHYNSNAGFATSVATASGTTADTSIYYVYYGPAKPTAWVSGTSTWANNGFAISAPGATVIYTFNSWNTSPDGEGTEFKAGTTTSLFTNSIPYLEAANGMTLYAIWDYTKKSS